MQLLMKHIPMIISQSVEDSCMLVSLKSITTKFSVKLTIKIQKFKFYSKIEN